MSPKKSDDEPSHPRQKGGTDREERDMTAGKAMRQRQSFLAPLPSDSDHDRLDRRLGGKMREVRKAAGLSLQEVAERAELSVGLISQIERGLTSPSIRSLRLLAAALATPVDHFFSRPEEPDEAERTYVVRPRTRRVLDLSHRGMTMEIISPPEQGAAMQTFITNLQPGGGSGIELDVHDGEEAGLVLCGQFELWLGDKRFLLSEGDSFRFNSRTPHRYRNPGETLTRVHWTATPPIY